MKINRKGLVKNIASTSAKIFKIACKKKKYPYMVNKWCNISQ